MCVMFSEMNCGILNSIIIAQTPVKPGSCGTHPLSSPSCLQRTAKTPNPSLCGVWHFQGPTRRIYSLLKPFPRTLQEPWRWCSSGWGTRLSGTSGLTSESLRRAARWQRKPALPATNKWCTPVWSRWAHNRTWTPWTWWALWVICQRFFLCCTDALDWLNSTFSQSSTLWQQLATVARKYPVHSVTWVILRVVCTTFSFLIRARSFTLNWEMHYIYSVIAIRSSHRSAKS